MHEPRERTNRAAGRKRTTGAGKAKAGMDFHEPTSLEEAIGLLAADDDAKCLAGGQTLVAVMNLGLYRPSALVSLGRIPGLTAVSRDADGSVSIGAMATHGTVAAFDGFADGHAVVHEAAGCIAHPAIRNMGTIGGSICHGDPAADYPSALVAADAEIDIVGPAGERTLPAAEFFVEFLTTALAPGELVTRVRLPASAEGSAGHYEKFARVDGDFATVSVAAVLAMPGGTCRHARIALGGCGPVPVRSAEADAALTGSALDEEAIHRAAALLVEASDPIDDVRGTAEYRRLLIPRLVRRALYAT